MRDTMMHLDGAGLAAPQIGVPLRVVIFGVHANPRYPDAEDVPDTVLINPVLEPIGEEMEEGWEGCLSVPDMRGRVPRCTAVRLECYDREAQRVEIVAKDFFARVVQHETDHLNGIVYVDRMRDLSSLSYMAEWQKHWLGIREQAD
jgi:peptide deformylase